MVATIVVGVLVVREAVGERLAVSILFAIILWVQIAYVRRIAKAGSKIGSFSREDDRPAPKWVVAVFVVLLLGLIWYLFRTFAS